MRRRLVLVGVAVAAVVLAAAPVRCSESSDVGGPSCTTVFGWSTPLGQLS